MPKINADSVRAHRAQVLAALIDSAEFLLTQDSGTTLTAGAVAARAGIARNSIYRYVDSIDDLIEMVATRGFPRWTGAVRDAVEAAPTPAAGVVAYVRANVEQAVDGDHAWRTALSRMNLSAPARARVIALHTELADLLRVELSAAAVTNPALVTASLQALVDACVRRVDAGDDPAAVIDYAGRVATILVSEATAAP
ncbi:MULTISPECIES: TetR/AcrR family transcriptional regulator [Nocardia]|uniref:TetR/AcrR family transcriptional regulator n=1 Tax=Nocardia TaxID=1817 RepID=UPI0006F9FECF|nr:MULTISPECIES: TetR/AcrR family transcriptional regulator [Nocardia]KQY32158.1 hypothetical protein ASD42_21360 [Nocardia sp. Root136]